MRGDFTKFGFRPSKHFAGVLMQQGRVQLDSDWNEQIDFQNWIDRLTNRDVIGKSGTPKLSPAFQVTLSDDKTDLLFSPGDVYIDGLPFELANVRVPVTLPANTSQVTFKSLVLDGYPLAVNDWIAVWDDAAAAAAQIRRITVIDPATGLVTLNVALAGLAGAAQPMARRFYSYKTQRQWPSPTALNPVASRTDLLFFDVWQRHVSAVEDPDIREIALGGPDTCTRIQTICQVKVMPGVTAANCDAAIANFPPGPSGGRLSSRVDTTQAPTDPCTVLAGGGYKGLENRLYRVEIHAAGNLGAATFKWSRDNGSLAFPVETFVTGAPTQIIVKQLSLDRDLALRKGDWIEVTTDEQELSGKAGILAQINDADEARRLLTLSAAVDTLAGQSNPRARRWDMPGNAITATAAEVELEDGVKIQFSGANFQAGDWWAFAARTETASVETLVASPPHGIRHAYARLALVTWQPDGSGGFNATIQMCLPRFPPLTAIAASDVSYDNNVCKFPNAKTVQDALDRLCGEQNLKFHNKHLHGWGVVCGLQVNCNGAIVVNGKRAGVKVLPGYALDCDGTDIRLLSPIDLNIIDMIAKFQAANPGTPLLDTSGNGDVNITLKLTGAGQVDLEIEPHKVKTAWQKIFQDTIWDDVVNNCLKPLQGFWTQQFTTPAGSTDLVSPGEKRLIALLNLIYQFADGKWGSGVYLSKAEHDLLQQIYDALKVLLASKTYCSMFDNARPFPAYAFPASTSTTIFGKGGQLRLRYAPVGNILVAVCGDERVLIYDTQAKVLSNIVQFPSLGAAVTDVAFSADGKTLHAIAIASGGTDSLWASGALNGTALTWSAPITVCDVNLLSIATHSVKPNVFYAVAHHKGIYEFSPPNIPNKPTPKWPFDAVGHITIEAMGPTVQIFATQGTGDDLIYTTIFTVPLSGNNLEGKPTVPFLKALAGPGQDGICVVRAQSITRLYVGRDDPFKAGSKLVEGFDLTNLAVPTVGTFNGNGLWDTSLVLASIPNGTDVVVGRMHHSRLDLLGGNDVNDVYPLQIWPASITTDPAGTTLYVAEEGSGTITVIPVNQLAAGARIGFPALATYRGQLLAAFADLAGGLLQYLKDCFCDRLLVNCPTCEPDDIIRLGTVSVRANAVEKVCNFSERKYVKTFPTVEYWFSLVPLIPLIRTAVEKFCCAALPNFFAKFQPAPQTGAFGAGRTFVTGQQVVGARNALSAKNRKAVIDTQTARVTNLFGLSGSIIADRITNFQVKSPAQTGVQQQHIVNQSVDAATTAIQARNGTVTTQPFDSSKGLAQVARFAGAPSEIPPGANVTLFQQNGVVKFFTIDQPAAAPPVAGTGPGIRVAPAFAASPVAAAPPVAAGPTAADLAALRADLENQKAELAKRDATIADLSKQVAAAQALTDRLSVIEKSVKDLQTPPKPPIPPSK